MEQEHEVQKSPIVAPLLIVVGGVLIVVSNFFHWGRVAATDGTGHRDLKGGTIVLVAGIIVILLGIALWVIRSRSARIVVSIIAIVGGVAALLIGAISLSTEFIRNVVADQLGDENGISHAEAEHDLQQSEASGKIETTRQPGVYFALAGGILVLIGGIGGLVTGREPVAPEAVPGEEFPGPYGTAPPPPPAAGEFAAQTAPSGAEGPGSDPAPPPPPAQPPPLVPSDTDPSPPPPPAREPPEQG
jgi:Tryptophan-associated transmembrane protein (Trp_oprn_chp)